MNSLKTKPVKKKNYKYRQRIRKSDIQLLLLQVPSLIYIFIFNYIPMYGIVIAFKKFNPSKGIFKSEWVGLKNFEFLFTSNDLWRITRNTVLYSLDFLFVGNICAIIVAILLYNLRSRRMVKLYNTIMILPTFISIVIVSYIVYGLLNPASGVFNRLLVEWGYSKVDWYADPKPWPVILTVVDVWRDVGLGCILYYAALMGIDSDLFDAAKIDGANKVQQTWYIAVPELTSVVAIRIIQGFGGLFSGDFGLFYQVTRNSAALYSTTDILNTYTFRALMQDNNIATSSAVGFAVSVVGLFMIIFVNGVVRKISYENRLF